MAYLWVHELNSLRFLCDSTGDRWSHVDPASSEAAAPARHTRATAIGGMNCLCGPRCCTEICAQTLDGEGSSLLGISLGLDSFQPLI